MASNNLPKELLLPIPENTKEQDLYKTLQDYAKEIDNSFENLADIEAIDAGDGLTDTANTFSVNVDDSTIEISGDALQVIPGGISHNDLADTHNLTTDVDHDSITNTHNLTTDIDHDALTNFTATEHFTMIDDDTFATASDTTAATSESIKAYVDNNTGGGIDYAVGATEYEIAAGDTERSTTNTSYTKVKEILLPRNGELRVDFEIKIANVSATGTASVYRNGVAVGAEQTVTNLAYQLKTQDISGWSAGDLCQVYYKTSNGSYAIYIQNFKIYATVPTVEVVNLD